MMYPRLQLLKELLRDDGVIFISIDDNEVAHLRMLMDEIFGPENFIGFLIWRKKEGGGQTDAFFVTEHEYVVVYARSKGDFKWQDEKVTRPENEFPERDPFGRFKLVRLAKWGSASRRQDRPTMHFAIKAPDGKGVVPRAPDGTEGRWRVGRMGMDQIISEGRLSWRKENGEWVAYEKIRFTEINAVKTLKARSILYDLATSGDGANELTEIFGRKDVFENPKPVDLIEFIIRRSCTRDSLVLDSFAGSGTTAHATLEVNGEDNGSRRFILVQMRHDTKEHEREKINICQEVAAERVRRVIQGYSFTTRKGTNEKVAGVGGSFSYARVGASLFGEYRDMGQEFPAYEELAKYIYYTETSS